MEPHLLQLALAAQSPHPTRLTEKPLDLRSTSCNKVSCMNKASKLSAIRLRSGDSKGMAIRFRLHTCGVHIYVVLLHAGYRYGVKLGTVWEVHIQIDTTWQSMKTYIISPTSLGMSKYNPTLGQSSLSHGSPTIRCPLHLLLTKALSFTAKKRLRQKQVLHI